MIAGSAWLLTSASAALQPQERTVAVGLNYAKTGPNSVSGLDQWRAANLAIEEINSNGGLRGKQIKLFWTDSKSKVDLTRTHVRELIDERGCQMIFGGSTSPVATVAAEICQTKRVPYFSTFAYADGITGVDAHRFSFRECNNSRSAAMALGAHLAEHFAGKKLLYITSGDTFGHQTEAILRSQSGTEDFEVHKGTVIAAQATDTEIKQACNFANLVKPDLLVLVLTGETLERALREATAQGLKAKLQIATPHLNLGLAERSGPAVMEGVLGTLPWCWQVPYQYDYQPGRNFVTQFKARYGRYPSSSGASTYTVLQQWKEAVERADSFAGEDVVKALEGHSFELLKGEQSWRGWDHQALQSIYVVRCKQSAEVRKDPLGLDFFELLGSMDAERAFQSKSEWNELRSKAGRSGELESLEPADSLPN